MPRVTGTNTFDLDDGDYVGGIVLIGKKGEGKEGKERGEKRQGMREYF